jgi:uncharacterized membrane protein YccF (DUF307 family)
VRFVWWLFIGWWASGIAVAVAWIALVTIVGIPLGIWIINRLPSILTLRPRTRAWSLGQDEQGRTVVSSQGRPQVAWPLRGIWFVLVGWWASAIWMAVAWLIQLTIIGIPVAVLRDASLRRQGWLVFRVDIDKPPAARARVVAVVRAMLASDDLRREAVA